MNIGVLGLGKLGLPVALAIESKGHTVKGYDINPAIAGYLKDKKIPFKEEGLQPLLDQTKLELTADIAELVKWADIIFIAVQTPHEPEYEGSTILPDTRKDFDYTYLTEAVAEVGKWCLYYEKKTIVITISTCLPGTYEQRIKNLLNEYVEYIYNPFFIAMGTVVRDFLNPEFVLIGKQDKDNTDEPLKTFYPTIHDKPILYTDITTAEAIKVSYNTFITTKTVLANLWGEIAHKVGANVDDIYKAWSMATDRLISPKYLKAGMGDGGGCHPRDNIALSWLATNIGLSYNFFDALMLAREAHAIWLADEADEAAFRESLPLILLGKSFKPETDIQTGSPALLVSNYLIDKHIDHVHVGEGESIPDEKAVYLVTTQHEEYATHRFHEGSIVFDPFGYIPDGEDYTVIRIGR